MPAECATIGQVLQENGYSTFWLGKNHNVPEEDIASGGTCCPLVIHWPKGIKAKGEIRDQYHHCTDIVPTILEVAGLEMPKVYRGVEQYPVNGVSMRYSFDNATAPTQARD